MRKLFFTIAMLSIFGLLYAKDYKVSPMNQKGDEININYLGAKTAHKSATTTMTNGFAGAGVVYGVVLSTGLTTEYITLYDSSTVCAGNGVQLSPKIFFEGATSAVKTFPKPVQVTYGTTVVSGSINGNTVQIIYRLNSDN